MKVILDKLLNEPVLIAALAVAVGAYYETSTAWGPVVALVGGVLTRQFTTPAREVEEVPVYNGETNAGYAADASVKLDENGRVIE